jgi:hypothetical protein
MIYVNVIKQSYKEALSHFHQAKSSKIEHSFVKSKKTIINTAVK